MDLRVLVDVFDLPGLSKDELRNTADVAPASFP